MRAMSPPTLLLGIVILIGTHVPAWASQPRPTVNLTCHDGTPAVTSLVVSTENGDFLVNAQCDSDQVRDGRCTLTTTVTFTGARCLGCVVNLKAAVIRAGHARVLRVRGEVLSTQVKPKARFPKPRPRIVVDCSA